MAAVLSDHRSNLCQTAFVECHLLRAVEAWTAAGSGDYEFRRLPDKEPRGADLVVVRDDEPWFLSPGVLRLTRIVPEP